MTLSLSLLPYEYYQEKIFYPSKKAKFETLFQIQCKPLVCKLVVNPKVQHVQHIQKSCIRKPNKKHVHGGADRMGMVKIFFAI